jgi:ATP-binding cassette subfamily B protein
MLSGPLQTIREHASDLQQASASVDRIQALLDLRPSVTDPVSPAVAALRPGPLSLEFEDVSFHYDDDQDVLRDVSFAVQPGRVLGVLGRTGSGKTTLTRLIFRLYDPAQGRLCLDGVDLRGLPVAEVRRRVGMVTQDVQLFRASIRDNLTFFSPAIDDTQIERALRELRLWEWVQSRPQGLDTVLSAGGGGQSAGEAQLLAFARVLLRDPGLVVLDEASSRLDPATENLLERAVDRLFASRTGLVIAHRLRTVQRADDILILEGGRVVEYGSRLALAADHRSRFYQLLQTGMEEALA